MPRKRYSAEEIIQHLRTVELEQGRGATLEKAAKKVDVTSQTMIRWKNEFGGLKVDQAKRLKELEAEDHLFEPRIMEIKIIDRPNEDLSLFFEKKKDYL